MLTDPNPTEARNIGIVGDCWPYGPNVDAAARRSLVDWATPLGLRIARRQALCPHWVLGNPCPTRSRTGTTCMQADRPLWADHVTAWTRNRRPAILLAQPYPGSGLEDSLDPVRDLGCKVTAGPTGWYGNGTVWIEITAP